MTRKLLFLCLLFQSVLFAQQQWRNLGPDDSNQAVFGAMSEQVLAFDQNDIPYLAFNDFDHGFDGKLTIRRYVSGQWETVGTAGLATTVNSTSSLAFDNNNIPYVAYSQPGSCVVKKFDGTAWVSVGSVGTSGYGLTLLFDAANAPHLGGMFGSDAIAGVKKYNGSAWVNLGINNASPIEVQHVSLALDENDVPYLAYSDVNFSNGKLNVKKLNGTLWESVGPANFSTGSAEYVTLKFSSDNIPYVGYKNNTGQKKATLKKFNGTDWETVGDAGISAGEVFWLCFALNSDDVPIFSYFDDSLQKVVIKAYTLALPEPGEDPEMAWAEVGSNYKGQTASLALDSEDNIHMGYRRVDKYDGTNWTTLGPVDISGYAYPEESYIAVTGDNTTYIAYIDFLEQKKKVKKWNGTSWEDVGAVSLGEDNFGISALQTGPDNTPYLLCGNGAGYLTVKKYNGTAWVNVGTANFNPQPWVKASFVIGNNNEVYVTGVTYEVNNFENDAHVWKYTTGNGWASTGMTGIANMETIYNVNIAVGSDNIPYIVYLDDENGNKVTVKKLNESGSGWDLVGESGVSSGAGVGPYIALTSQNIPYVVYHEGPLYKPTVKKFTGMGWEVVGTSQFLTNVYKTRIAIDNNDVPYISYYDGSTTTSADRISVKKYNGTSWVTVGGEGFTAAPNSNGFADPILAFNPNNVPVIICATYGLYVKYFGGENAISSTETADFVNLEGPAAMTIAAGSPATAYAQVLKDGVTEAAGPGEYVDGWIGISTQNTNPATWTTWVPATFSSQEGDNDKYQATLGNGLAGGTYYYASRFQINNGSYKYGGYSTTGGGFWDGEDNVSGILTVTCNTAAPLAAATQYFCDSATVAGLQAEGQGLLWYSVPVGGLPLSSSVALIDGTTYYVTQTLPGACESARVPVNAVITTTPAMVLEPDDETLLVCQGTAISELQAPGTNLKWYTSWTGGEPLAPDTDAEDTAYYVSQTVNGCESTRVQINVITILSPAPGVDNTQSFCNGATVADLTATAEGTITWYAGLAGGTPLSENTTLGNGAAYYVSQTLNGCLSTRVMVTVTINSTPAPEMDDITLCNGANVATLEALYPGLLWYPGPTGNTAMGSATILVSGTTYYASQIIALCESERTSFTVTITEMAAPDVEALQTITVGNTSEATLEDINANLPAGATVAWYASEEDALAGENALAADTQIISGTTYYGTYLIGGCTSSVFAVTADVALGTGSFDTTSFSYYPNPVKNMLTLSYSDTINTIEVYNMIGQQVIVQQLNQSEGRVDMSALSAGAYLVKVTAGETSKTIRIIKK
jgi:hypothetical protein